MTPREAADRLFNRIMTAAERGDAQEALRFAPMALQAYERLGPLDNDARYHVGLITATTGDIESARAHIDMLRQSVPDHLLGIARKIPYHFPSHQDSIRHLQWPRPGMGDSRIKSGKRPNGNEEGYANGDGQGGCI